MAGIFKAYDVRGLYPGQLNEELARRIGMAFERLVTLEGDQGAALPRTVVVSRDMRDHSVPLSSALCAGLTSAGLDVLDIGLATTPMNYFATGHLGTAGGIQVTASHNAAEYNGLKFSLAGAVPVSGDHGIPIIERHALGEEPAPAATPGRVEVRSIEAEYAEHVLSFLDRAFEAGDAPKLRLAADAANGMGTIYRPLLEACGVELLPLYFELDGSFPNHEANP
ncbi:MAG: phosphomannomutase/phosphoglucomutase, partial [Holophagales bacterium]|nr:phosphomannomutase/phosphoglucomutase [Holophagales bacterium]